MILYADTITRSIKAAVTETERRRALQRNYNEKHGITPTTISKDVGEAPVSYTHLDVYKRQVY